MNQVLWTAVDQYIDNLFVGPDPHLEAALRLSDEAGLPAINVSPSQGKLLHLLAKMREVKKILEIGTLGGYSTMWLARALPEGGQVITLEADPQHVEVAQENIKQAGLESRVEIRLGQALDILPDLVGEGCGPFDLIFVDADKANNSEYFSWALKLSRPGTVLIFDNVIREGAVIDDSNQDLSVKGSQRLNELMATDSRVMATAIQTVGSKGHDGFALAIVK